MTCPGSGRIPLNGGSMHIDGKLAHQVLCRECGRWFSIDLDQPGGMALPKHEKTQEPQGRLL